MLHDSKQQEQMWRMSIKFQYQNFCDIKDLLDVSQFLLE